MVKDVRNPSNQKAAKTAAFIKYIISQPFKFLFLFLNTKINYEEKRGESIRQRNEKWSTSIGLKNDIYSSNSEVVSEEDF